MESPKSLTMKVLPVKKKKRKKKKKKTGFEVILLRLRFWENGMI